MTMGDLIKYVSNIPNKKSAGVDEISPSMLKMAVDVIPARESLLALLNECIRCNHFPSSLKIARITPIHKKGDTNVYNHYRPISVLPVISKVFERHVTLHLSKFLEENNLLYKYQSGFRSNHSCQSALIDIVDEILDGLD